MKQKQKIKKPIPKSSPIKVHQKISSEDRKRRLTLGIIIGVFGFLLYANTLSNGYVLDDFSAIKENNIVRQGISAIPEIFKTSYRQGYLSVKDGLYRPLSLAMFAIEWNFFPDKPSVSHFVNIFLYGLTGLLLFLTLCKLFSQIRSGEIIAFITSILFIAHPIHTEIVANIKSRDEILCFLFTIASLRLVLSYLEKEKRKYLFYALFSFFLAFLSKETVITFLALLPLALHFFTRVPLKKILFITSAFVVVTLFCLFVRSRVLQGALTDDSVSMSDNLIVAAKDFNTHIASAFYILGLYVKLLFFPHPLVYDYSYNQVPLVKFNNMFSIASLAFYLAIGIYAAFVLWKSFRHRSSVISHQSLFIAFGILFFLVTIFLFSNLVLIIGTSMGERLMYFPSLGFCLCVAGAMYPNPKGNNSRFFLPLGSGLVLLVVILFYSYKTLSRNPDWKDNITLYSHDVNLSPNSTHTHYYLGLELTKVVADAEQDTAKKKIYEDGIAELEKSVSILPSFLGAYTQIGVAYFRMKNYQKAIENYEKAASMKQADALTLNNIGTVYFQWKKYYEAAEKFRQAVQMDPRYVHAYMNLGSVYGTIGDFDKSIESFLNAIKYAPDNAEAYFYLALTYENKGDKTNAEKYYVIARQLNPKLKK